MIKATRGTPYKTNNSGGQLRTKREICAHVRVDRQDIFINSPNLEAMAVMGAYQALTRDPDYVVQGPHSKYSIVVSIVLETAESPYTTIPEGEENDG